MRRLYGQDDVRFFLPFWVRRHIVPQWHDDVLPPTQERCRNGLALRVMFSRECRRDRLMTIKMVDSFFKDICGKNLIVVKGRRKYCKTTAQCLKKIGFVKGLSDCYWVVSLRSVIFFSFPAISLLFFFSRTYGGSLAFNCLLYLWSATDWLIYWDLPPQSNYGCERHRIVGQ